jgi:hypothetical protein
LHLDSSAHAFDTLVSVVVVPLYSAVLTWVMLRKRRRGALVFGGVDLGDVAGAARD